MPLQRAPGKPRVELNKVVFAMRDVVTGAPVACSVTEDALAKLSGGRSSIAALDAMFDQHRAVVENIASSKYDAGRAAPHIREQDIALPL